MREHEVAGLAGLIGFVLGGVLADALSEVATAIGAGMTVGTFIGAVTSWLRGRQAEIGARVGRAAVVGGALGVLALGLDGLLRLI